MSILNLPMGDNDAKAATVGDYLRALLREVWLRGEGFSGKRPFGNGGWECDIYTALVNGGAIKGEIDEDGYLDSLAKKERTKADALILEAIGGMGCHGEVRS